MNESRFCPDCGFYSSFGYGFFRGELCAYETCDDDCGWFLIEVVE